MELFRPAVSSHGGFRSPAPERPDHPCGAGDRNPSQFPPVVVDRCRRESLAAILESGKQRVTRPAQAIVGIVDQGGANRRKARINRTLLLTKRFTGERLLSIGPDPEARALAIEQNPASLLKRGEQLVKRLGKLPHAVLQQLARDFIQ